MSSESSEIVAQVGDRVQIVGIMADDPRPMEVGVEGTVTNVEHSGGKTQYVVDWDNGRSLKLLPLDPFVLVPRSNI